MKIIAISAAALAIGVSVPAMADEARVEVRGGVAFADGDGTYGVAGIAGGYDFDLGGSGVFVGIEGAADVSLGNISTGVYSLSGRLGTKIGEAGRLYVVGGYSVDGVDAAHIGGGYQHQFGQRVYGKVEYRRYLDRNSFVQNAAVVGVGLRF